MFIEIFDTAEVSVITILGRYVTWAACNGNNSHYADMTVASIRAWVELGTCALQPLPQSAMATHGSCSASSRVAVLR